MISIKEFRGINMWATGRNIRQLRIERNLTVRDLQEYFGFSEPRAIYKWQNGETLPDIENLLALSDLFEVPVERIIVRYEMSEAA